MDSGKQRLRYVDTVRFLAVCLIIVSHFNAALSSANINIAGNLYIIKSEYNYGSFGTWGVSLFFIISGVVLYYNYSDMTSLKNFYKKRFMGIYPTFWFCYVLVFLYLFWTYKTNWFGEVPKWKMILSVLGIDGYFSYCSSNFYLIGEWFLGCIIIFYLVFPVLNICVKKFPLQTIALAVILYLITAYFNPFKVPLSRNLIIRGCDFLFGMVWAKYMNSRKVSWKMLLPCVLCMIVSVLYCIPQMTVLNITLFGQSLFVILVFMFERIDLSRLHLVQQVGKYSYEVFLLHHVCINLYVGSFRDHAYGIPGGIILLVGVCLLIYIVVALEKILEKEIKKAIKIF